MVQDFDASDVIDAFPQDVEGFCRRTAAGTGGVIRLPVVRIR